MWRKDSLGPEAGGQLCSSYPHSLTLRASTAFHSSTAATHAQGVQEEGAEGPFPGTPVRPRGAREAGR